METAKPHRPKVLVVDDDPGVLDAVAVELENDFLVYPSQNLASAHAFLGERIPNAALLDLSLANGESGLSLLKDLHEQHPDVPVIMLSGRREQSTVAEALKLGAVDYVSKPFDGAELVATLKRVIQNLNPDAAIEFLGRSVAARNLKARAEKAAAVDTNILIVGETGTGKEILARTIHQARNDPKRPFIAVNCAALPAELIESTLFGHEAGAFTGATKVCVGKFEQAHGGDIFLDEINAMPYPLQAKLLRVLQEKEFERVGGQKPTHSEFRVIAASNEDLFALVKRGTFREDLAYRLCVIQFHVPPLRERPEDIPLLMNHFLSSPKRNPKGVRLSAECKGALAALPWPGNARQLFNALEEMISLTDRRELKIEDIPGHAYQTVARAEFTARPLSEFEKTVEDLERELIRRALRESNGSITYAAKALAIPRQALYRRMERLHMEGER